MKTYALSICIPTMNRPEYMQGLLDNILGQIIEDDLTGRLEIVVVDGGVGDATRSVVDAFASRHQDVVYFQRETRSNIDADILKSVELAHGEYCWLFSDDDRLTAHAIRHLLETLGRHSEVAGCFVNRCSYNSDLTHRVSEPHGWPHSLLKRDHQFATKDECFEVLGIDLGFISSQVVKRELWTTVIEAHDLSPFYQCYLMFYVIGLMMDRNAHWLYVDRPLVIQRTGNDSFLAREGFYRRQLLEHTSLGNVVGGHYSTSGVVYRRVFRRMVQRLPRVVANMKSSGVSYATQWQLIRMYIQRYGTYPECWYMILPIFLLPNVGYKLVKSAYFFVARKTQSAPWLEAADWYSSSSTRTGG